MSYAKKSKRFSVQSVNISTKILRTVKEDLIMNKLRSELRALVDEIADNLIDSFGIDYYGYEFDRRSDVPSEKLSKLSELLIRLNDDDFSFLLEYPEFEETAMASLRGFPSAREDLAELLDNICIKHCNSDIERFINFEITRMRE